MKCVLYDPLSDLMGHIRHISSDPDDPKSTPDRPPVRFFFCCEKDDGGEHDIRAEVMEIAGGDEEQAAVMMRALLEGLRTIEDTTAPKEEPPMSGPGHNSGTADSYSVTADELRQFIERAEQLASEKKDIAEQEKELFAEAKARGYDTKVMRKVIALRKRKPDEIAEESAVLAMYCEALGVAHG